jgi:phage shock protein PspC (stress-responsive transcriptional regulator)
MEITMQAAAQSDHAAFQTDEQPALPLRGDTFLGVCHALGEDFGIPADLLRIAFAALFFWNMTAAVGTYLAIGAIIALARWAYPARRKASVAPTPAAPEAESNTDAAEELSLAA